MLQVGFRASNLDRVLLLWKPCVQLRLGVLPALTIEEAVNCVVYLRVLCTRAASLHDV